MVTIENFLAWKVKFDQDVAELKRKRLKEEEQAGKGKLTGNFVAHVHRVLIIHALHFPLNWSRVN